MSKAKDNFKEQNLAVLFYSQKQADRVGTITLNAKNGQTYQYTEMAPVKNGQNPNDIKPGGNFDDYTKLDVVDIKGGYWHSHLNARANRSTFTKRHP